MSSRHLFTGGVVILLLSATAVAGATTRNVVNDQEHRLLVERTNELAATLTTTISSVQAELSTTGAAAATYGPTSPLFVADAKVLTAAGGSLVVVQPKGSEFVVIASSGTQAQAAAPVGARAQLVRRALSAKGMVTTLIAAGSIRHFVAALKTVGSTPAVSYIDYPVVLNSPATQSGADSPYRELNAAIYASATPNPSTLLITSGKIPTSARNRADKTFTVGVDTWLIVASARSPLVGGVAHTLSWWVWGGGALVTALLALLTEVLARRRSYALALVAERTVTLRQAQQDAEHANSAKSQFISRMSHELRTPLNAVLGFGQVLELDHVTEEQHRLAVGHIISGGRHLLDLVNEILDISQVESGQLPLSPEAVRVSDLLQDAVELLEPLAERHGILLTTADTHSCDKYIFADRQRVKQILLNVIGNGIKYNRQGGSVTITCAESTPGRMSILVADTGPGIDPSQLSRLFTPFERLGAERTAIEGTGIGLALSRRLAEAMGGVLDLESVVGRGSTFRIEFPLVEGPVDRYERLGGPARVSLAVNHPDVEQSILHIEDNISNVKLIEQILVQRPSVTLIPTMQGRIGLELAREHLPMLILLDLNLPDMQGEEVLTRLRDDPRTASIPVVIISADASQRQVQRLLATGAHAYLTKPIDVRELLHFIDDAAAAHAVKHGATDPPTGAAVTTSS